MSRPAPFLLVAAVLAAAPAGVAAHPEGPLAPNDLWRAWSADPFVLIGLTLAGWLYVRGVAALWRQAGPGRGMARWRVAAYFGGLLASVVALVSPLDALAGVLFSAHMAQHLILVLVAAPLLVLGAPLVPFLWALPRPWRVAVARWTRRPAPRALWLVLTQPVVVLVLHLTALWAWHAPAAYQAALASERVHFLEHASLLGTALLFWWVVIQPHGRRRLGYGGALALVFAAALSGTALAALNAFVDHDWYPAYAASTAAWGLDPLTDQQLAGILMGAPAATIYAAAALALVAACLRASERNAWRREAGGAHSGFVAATSARPVGDD